MVFDYTRFKCDDNFRSIKRLYYKTTVDCIEYVVNIVKKSSITMLNKV